MSSRITAHDALIYLMVTMSAVDKAMNDAELARIGRLVTFLPVFDGFDEERLVEVTRAAAELLTGPEGLDIVLEVVRDAVPHKFYDTAYALAVEIASADYNIQRRRSGCCRCCATGLASTSSPVRQSSAAPSRGSEAPDFQG